MCPRSSTRTSRREPQVAGEQLVEEPTVLYLPEQTVDIAVRGGGGRLGDLQGFFPEQSPTALGGGGLQGSLPGQGSAASSAVLRSPTYALNTADEPFDVVFRTFSQPKKREFRRPVECESARALELIRTERSSVLNTARERTWPCSTPSGTRFGSASFGGASDSVHRPWLSWWFGPVLWRLWKHSTYFPREAGFCTIFSMSPSCLAVRRSKVAFGRTAHLSCYSQ